MKRVLLIVAVIVFGSYYLLADDFINDPNLEREVRETINTQCEHQVKAFTNHLAFIAKKENPDSIKDYHIEACMDLFVGRGDNTLDKEGNVIIPAPRIEVTSVTRQTKNSYFIRKYLERLKGLQYSKIVFKSSKCYIADGGIKEIEKGSGEYVATVSFYQVFQGYKGDLLVYKDKTEKRVTVHIKRNASGNFTISLGDVKADNCPT